MSVSAKDKGTGKEQKITIKADGGLSKRTSTRWLKKQKPNKEADKKKRELVDAKTQAETLTHQIEKQLKEHGDKISAEEKKAIEDAQTDVTEAVKSDDAEKIKTAVAKLTEVSMKLGEAVYKQVPARTKIRRFSDSKDEKVVDAEFEEVKKDKPEDKKNNLTLLILCCNIRYVPQKVNLKI